jgi:hypothetical protein
MVEAPFAILTVLFLAMGAIAFAQIMLSYQHLTGSTRAAARFAAKNDYDPTLSPATSSRRPSTAQVTSFTSLDASPLNLATIGVTNDGGTDNASGSVGQAVRVSVNADVNDGAYRLVSSLVNGLGSLFGASQVLPYPYRIHSEAVALYE